MQTSNQVASSEKTVQGDSYHHGKTLGYLLGVLAWRTRHLWGGIIIHLGIAMFFEVVGIARLLFII